MKYLFLIVTIYLVSFMVRGEIDAHEKRQKLFALIEKEMNTIRKLGNLGPKLSYRLIELKTEKMRLIKQVENNNFMSNKLGTQPKAAYFKTSKNMEREIAKEGLNLVARFPKFKGVSEIYYTLALNNRDFGDESKVLNYLSRSLETSPKRSKNRHLIHVAFAEQYYNLKKYPQAIKHYQVVLKNPADEWKAKHHYNYAWCLFKRQKYDQAIDNLQLAYRNGKGSQYISVRDQVFEAIGVFYPIAGRAPEAVDFYLAESQDPSPLLLKMAKRTAEKGQWKETKLALDAAKKHSKANKEDGRLSEIYFQELTTYRQFKQQDLMQNAAQELSNLGQLYKMAPELKEKVISEISSIAGYQQEKLKKISSNSLLLNSTISFFDNLIALDKIKERNYLFFQGETYFSVDQKFEAAKKYRHSLEVLKQVAKNDEKLARKNLEGIFAGLEYLPQDKKEDFTLYSFENFVEFFPKDEKSPKIFERLFAIYFKKAEMKETVRVVFSYHQAFKERLVPQRAMHSKILQYHIKKKETKNLAHWIKKMEAGFLSYPKPEIEKITIILGQILFQKIEKIDNDKAIIALTKIAKDKDRYPNKTLGEAHFRLAHRYERTGLIQQMIPMTNASLNLSDVKDNMKRRDSFFNLLLGLAARQEFTLAEKYGNLLLNKFCLEKDEINSKVIDQIILASMTEKRFKEAYSFVSKRDNCLAKPELSIDKKRKIIAYLKENRQETELFGFMRKYLTSKIHQKQFKKILTEIYWESILDQKDKLRDEVLKIMKGHHNPNQEMLTILDFNIFLEEFNQIKGINIGHFKNFEPKLFEAKLEKLTKTMEQVDQLSAIWLKKKNPNILLLTSFFYQQKTREIEEAFTSFKVDGLEKAESDALTKQVHQIGRQFGEKGRNLLSKTRTTIEEKSLVTSFPLLLTSLDYDPNLALRLPASKLLLPTNFGGLK